MNASPLDSTLGALADPARRGAVELLRQAPRSAGELASALRLRPPLMSRHLRLLRLAGLVQIEFSPADARVRIYSLRPQALAVLRRWLEGLDAHWGAQLGAFKSHVENETKGK